MILALLLLAQDVRVEKIERLAVEVPRPLRWTPLAVTLASEGGFTGDLKIRSRFGFDVAKRVVVPPRGALREIMPALDPEAVEVGEASVPAPRPGGRADLAVAVDASLPYAGALTSSAKARIVTVGAADLRALAADGLLDGVDLLLIGDPAGLELSAVPAWARAATLEEAERAIAGAVRAPRIEAVDAPIWELAPQGGWVASKRANGVLFAAGYAFVAFAALALAGRRGGKALAAAVAGTAVAGAALYAGLFPRGQVWIEEIAAESGPAEHRIWFAGAATPVETELSLPRLAKPVFRESAGAERPFTLRLSGRGCVVEGLALGPGARACFTASGPGGAASGTPAAPGDPLRAPFERFGSTIRVDRGAARVTDVDAPGLADARRRVRLRISP